MHILGFVLILGLTGCGGLRKHATISYKKMREESIVQIPFEVDQSKLEKALLQYIPDTIFEGSERDGLPVNIRVYKGKPLSIAVHKDIVEITLPMEVKMIKRMGFLTASAEGGLVMTLQSKLDIDADWHPKTRTILKEYHWTKEPRIKLLGFSLKVGEWSRNFIDHHKEEWLTALDDSLSRTDYLRYEMVALVDQISRPVPLDSAGKMKMHLKPLEIGLSPFNTAEGIISGALRLSFDIDIQEHILPDTAEIEDVVVDPDLPVFQWDIEGAKQQENAFALTFKRSELQYFVKDWLAHAAQEEKSVEVKGKKLTISGVDILTQGNKIGARVNFNGDRRGTLEFVARPAWNNRRHQIELKEEEVRLRMNGLASKLALLLFKHKLKKTITRSVEEAINERLKLTIKDMERELNDKLPQGRIRLTDYMINPIQVNDDLLLMDVRLIVKGETQIRGIPIKVVE